MEWINAKDKMPKNEQLIACINDREDLNIGYSSIEKKDGEKFLCCGGEELYTSHIVFWIPLPAIPHKLYGIKIKFNDLSEEGKQIMLRLGKNDEIYIPEYFITKEQDKDGKYRLEFPITKDAKERCGYGRGINGMGSIHCKINL